VKLTEAVAVAQALGMLLEDLVYEYESVVRHDQGVHRAVAELEAAAERILARARSLHHESLDDDVDTKPIAAWLTGDSMRMTMGHARGRRPEAGPPHP
jgi:hypothetical protein